MRAVESFAEDADLAGTGGNTDSGARNPTNTFFPEAISVSASRLDP